MGKGHYGSFEMTTQTAPSPVSPSNQSPLALVQPRQRNRATYVQRWKVLRDRNKNLPMLDFNAKATGVPKKYQAPSFPGGSFSRSYTYDAMKLPSISTASVVTGVSNASLKSDGYRRRGRRDKKSSLQVLIHYERWKFNQNQQREQQSESLQDLTTLDLTSLDKDYLGISTQLSKSLTNLAEKKDSQESSNTHRYERFSYSKQITSRTNAGSKAKSRDLKDISGGGTFARENTLASSYISQDKDKKQYIEKRDQPHKDAHSEKFKELKKIYGSRKDKEKNEPEKQKETHYKSVRILTPPSPSTYRNSDS